MRGGRLQRADMGPDQEQLGVTDDDVTFLDLRTVGPDGFHLPALESHACLVALFDEIIEKGLLVVGDGHTLEYAVRALG